jgi:glutaredoxin/glutathione-dependent peroxiredoxin
MVKHCSPYFPEHFMTIAIGDKLPDATFKIRVDNEYADATTQDVFAGKKTVLFAVPGAFTPTCSMNHLPGFLENRDVILGKGVDQIAVVAVNDHHVMKAWAEASGGKGKLLFLADGAGKFTKAVGMDADMGPLGLRSKRYSMIVEDGVVRQLNVEPGHGVEISGAATIMSQL